MAKIELEKDEINIIYTSLILLNNKYVNEIKTLKKNKFKYGLDQKEKELKLVRKLSNFFAKI